MKNVKFAVVEVGGVMQYPDVAEKFSALVVRGGFVYASYTGQVTLTEEAPPYDGSWHITKLAFRSRFTAAEKVGLEAAASVGNQLGFALRASMADQRDATYIDLKRPDTIAGVQQLEAATLLAVGRAAVILETPPTEAELYQST